MCCIIWNIHGARRREHIDHLKAIIAQHSISLVVLLEPMVSHYEVDRLAYTLGFPYYHHGRDTNSHIWIFWKENLTVEPLYCSDQALTVRIHLRRNQAFLASFVYASCLERIRRDLWDHLSGIQQTANTDFIPWLVTGDFNTIAHINEKQEGLPVDLPGIQEFQDFIGQNGLLDAGFQGPTFTWCSNRHGQGRMKTGVEIAMIRAEIEAEEETTLARFSAGLNREIASSN